MIVEVRSDCESTIAAGAGAFKWLDTCRKPHRNQYDTLESMLNGIVTFVKSQMLIQMTRLCVPLAADVAQIRSSANRFRGQFAGLSFLDVKFVRMLNQIDGRHERLATLLAQILIAGGLLIVQRKEMACSVSAKFQISELIQSVRGPLRSPSVHLCSNSFSSVSYLPRHSWHTKYVFKLMRFSRSYTRDGHSDWRCCRMAINVAQLMLHQVH